MNDNYTHRKIRFFSHWFVHSKNQETRSGFHVFANETSGSNVNRSVLMTSLFSSVFELKLCGIFSWFLYGRVVSNLCQNFPFKDSRNCVAHDENCIASNAILVLQEMRQLVTVTITPVSNVREAAEISLFSAPNGLNKLQEMHFKFPST